jgi:hypothetical protein
MLHHCVLFQHRPAFACTLGQLHISVHAVQSVQWLQELQDRNPVSESIKGVEQNLGCRTAVKKGLLVN